MKFTSTPISGAFVIEPEPRSDSRGAFMRTFCEREFEKIGLATAYVQTNVSRTLRKGTIRGMHFQRGAAAEDKLVRVCRGRVIDVIIDLRESSPSFSNYFSVELAEDNFRELYVPRGCAHGFLTLQDDCEVIYQVSNFYSPEDEAGVRWDDPFFKIHWPLQGKPILSDKDATHPDFSPSRTLK
jgi:dTDP-4-dehydrorhamnose 3,5-epimerase